MPVRPEEGDPLDERGPHERLHPGRARSAAISEHHVTSAPRTTTPSREFQRAPQLGEVLAADKGAGHHGGQQPGPCTSRRAFTVPRMMEVAR